MIMKREKDMEEIYFGTDGWRGIIGETFTFENVRRVGKALAYLAKERRIDGKPVVIGYDYRFMSEYFARAIYEELVSEKIEAELSDRAIPTPALSHATRARKAAFGVMITASHNPHFYSGIKFKAPYGGPVMPEFTFDLSRHIQNVKNVSRQSTVYAPKVPTRNFLSPYLSALKRYVNFPLLKNARLKVAVDSMHATGGTLIQDLLQGTKIHVHTIRAERNPLFDLDLPEPIPALLNQLSSLVKGQKCDLGLATDGDADRIGVLDSSGRFVTLHYLMPLLYEYLMESRGMKGDAVRTTSTDALFDPICAEHGQRCIEVPVGYNNVCEAVLREDILVGGEESGGICFKNHIPERDGILSALLLIEMMACKIQKLEKLVTELIKRFHPVEYMRIDRVFDRKKLKANLESLIKNPPARIAGSPLLRTDTKDGIKFYLASGCWMLMRVSDTEPKGRIYVGGRDLDSVKKTLRTGEKLLFS